MLRIVVTTALIKTGSAVMLILQYKTLLSAGITVTVRCIVLAIHANIAFDVYK